MTGSAHRDLMIGCIRITRSLSHFCMLTLCIRWFSGDSLDVFLGFFVTVWCGVSAATAFLYIFEARRVIMRRKEIVRSMRDGK